MNLLILHLKYNMINKTYQWLLHGGHYGNNNDIGIFGFGCTGNSGNNSTYNSFRLVATIR